MRGINKILCGKENKCFVNVSYIDIKVVKYGIVWLELDLNIC